MADVTSLLGIGYSTSSA